MNEAYDGTDLMTQYGAEVERLFADGPPTFVQDLRNYFLHYDLARSTGRMHQSTDAYKSEILLDANRLRQWDGWKATAKEWLQQQPDQLDLRAHLDDYETRVRELYAWVEQAIRAEHAGEVEATEALMWEHDRLVVQIPPELGR